MPVVRKFSHKPTEVEILIFDGNNHQEIMEFSKGQASWYPGLGQLKISVKIPGRTISKPVHIDVNMCVGEVLVKKPNGDVYIANVQEIQEGFDEVKD